MVCSDVSIDDLLEDYQRFKDFGMSCTNQHFSNFIGIVHRAKAQRALTDTVTISGKEMHSLIYSQSVIRKRGY